MFLKPCLSVATRLSCHTFSRLGKFVALRSLSSASLASAPISSRSHYSPSKHHLGSVLPHSPFCDHRSMPWAGQVACNSNHSLLHLNGLRKGLAASQRLASNLAPYVGGVTAFSAGTFCLQRQQGRQSKRRGALSHGASVVEMRAPADIYDSSRASSSSSDSDGDMHTSSRDSNPAAANGRQAHSAT